MSGVENYVGVLEDGSADEEKTTLRTGAASSGKESFGCEALETCEPVGSEVKIMERLIAEHVEKEEVRGDVVNGLFLGETRRSLQWRAHRVHRGRAL